MTKPTLILTRAKAASESFAADLSARTNVYTIKIIPLFETVFVVPESSAKQEETIIFTSRNGVLGFLNAFGPVSNSCFCVGPHTAAFAKENGLSVLETFQTAKDLQQHLNPKTQYYYARGKDISTDLSTLGNVQEGITYHHVGLSAPRKLFKELETAPCCIPLFSKNAAVHFLRETRNLTLDHHHAVSISETVADILRPHCKHVHSAEQPNRQGMIDAILKIAHNPSLVDPS